MTEQENENIHKVLSFACNYGKKGVESEFIANNLSLPLHEVNKYIRKIIEEGDGKDCASKDSLKKESICLLVNQKTKEAYWDEKYLNRNPLKYIIHISTSLNTNNIFNLSDKNLETFLNAYKKGKENFTISGKRYFLKNLLFVRIFRTNRWVDETKFLEECESRQLVKKAFPNKKITDPRCIELIATEVTDEIIGDIEYGEQVANEAKDDLKADFIDAERIQELRGVDNSNFDLKRLIQLCDELNDCFQRQNYFAVAMLGRTITNHIPPIFGCKNFDEVVDNLSWGRSNKKNLSHLRDSLKHIADDLLHSQVCSKETLPNSTRVDFKNDLDVLLGEIIRKLI